MLYVGITTSKEVHEQKAFENCHFYHFIGVRNLKIGIIITFNMEMVAKNAIFFKGEIGEQIFKNVQNCYLFRIVRARNFNLTWVLFLKFKHTILKIRILKDKMIRKHSKITINLEILNRL